jgi:hypothetical protein
VIGPRGEGVVLNVVWTGDVFLPLAPFTASVVRHSAARVRFVANACSPRALAAMEAVAAAHPDRVEEVLVVSEDRMLRHGTCLDIVLRDRDDGDAFALLDPDILARGPWIDPLVAALDGADGVTSGREAWSTTNVRPAAHNGVAGEHFFDQDGFVLGSPHLAIYRRDAVRESAERWAVGFGTAGNELSEVARQRLVDGGRSYWVYDTGKVLNILVQLDGGRLVHEECPALLHVGGVAHLLAPPGSVPGVVAGWGEDDAWTRDPAHARRATAAAYTAAACRACREGTPMPAPPEVDDAELAARLAAVRDGIVEVYAAVADDPALLWPPAPGPGGRIGG